MKVDGACHCGAIQFDAEIDPNQVVICHCTDCQTFSSAPYRVSIFGVPLGDVQVKGNPTFYTKIGGSGQEVFSAFCGTCGTALYSTKNLAEGPVNLRIGVLNQRNELTPKMQGFCSSSLAWTTDLESIHKVPE